MDDTNFSQPGQIDYAHQQEMLENLPNDPHTLTYLQSLLNNPATPFLKFLVLGKQEQVNKAIAAGNTQKTLSGGQNAAPPPTIKDKIQQESGIMALQNAQRNMMGAPQVGAITPPTSIPQAVPQATPEPTNSVEPESVQHAANGGIMHAPVDPRMFDFAQGGIVAFKEGEEVEDKKPTLRSMMTDTIARQKEGQTASAPQSEEEKIAQIIKDLRLPKPASEMSAAETERYLNEAKAKKVADLKGESFTPTPLTHQEKLTDIRERRGSEPSAFMGRAQRGAENITGAIAEPIERGIGAIGNAVTQAGNFFTLPESEYNALYQAKNKVSENKIDPRTALAAIQANSAVSGGNPNGTYVPSELRKNIAPPTANAAPAGGAAPSVAPVGGGGAGVGGGGIGQLPAGMTSITPQKVKDMANALMQTNPYEDEIKAAYVKKKPAEFDLQKAIDNEKQINEALGIGTYGKNRREQMAELERKFEENQPSSLEKLIGLGRAFSRPGARAGEMGAEGARQMQEERSAKMQFAEVKNKMQDEIEKADEIIRTGTASQVRAARAKKEELMEAYKNEEVTMLEKLATIRGTAQNTATTNASQILERESQNAASILGHQISANATVRSAELHRIAANIMANKPTETERFKAELVNTYNDAEKAKPGSGEAAVDRAVALQTRAGTAVQGKRYDQPNKDAEHAGLVYKALAADTSYGRAQDRILRLSGKEKLNAKEKALLDSARDFASKRYNEVSSNIMGGARGNAFGGGAAPASEGQVYRPTSQGDFDNVPAGATFVNPADGKTYIKK